MYDLFACLYYKGTRIPSSDTRTPKIRNYKIASLYRSFVIYIVIMIIYTIFSMITVIPVHAARSNRGSETPLQLLTKSVDAMQHLKSFHFDLNMALISAISGKTDDFPTTTIEMTGARVKPDLLHLQLSLYLNYKDLIPSLNEIIAGKKVYIQNLKAQWYVLEASTLPPLLTDSTLNENYYPFYQIRLGTIKDDGLDTLDGVSLHHLTITFDEKALAATTKLWNKGSSKLQRPAMVTKASFDYWIDEATAYIHQSWSQLTFVEVISSSKPSTHKINTLYLSNNYSKFDAESITLPENAIPASSLAAVFATDAKK